MKDIGKLLLSLGLVCFIGSSALAFVYSKTKAPIKEAQAKALSESLKLVLPAETTRTEEVKHSGPTTDEATLFKAFDKDGKQLAYAGLASGPVKGFGGPVKVLAGIGLDGKVLAVVVTEHSETPGVGTKATDRKVEKSLWDVLRGKTVDNAFPPNELLDRYKGLEVDGEQIAGVHGIAGATYSSKAVQSGIDAISKAYINLIHNTGK